MRLITLLTDFGWGSPYPAEMKGVLASQCRAALVDITHDVPPHDISCGAYLLAAAAPVFPAGTIHLAVVDPGVGTERYALAVASGGQFFIGPDNGLLMSAARTLGEPRAFLIDVVRFVQGPVSQTFHGRDVFAPVAAALARGLPVEAVGRAAPSPVVLPDAPARCEPGRIYGRVLYRDPFGNLVTNIPSRWLDRWRGSMMAEGPEGRRAVRVVRTYADGAPDELIVLPGSSGTVEIAMNGRKVADVLRMAAGDPFTLFS